MIGIIGGTGLYSIEGLEVLETKTYETPFGLPSSAVVRGRLAGAEIAFLPRHGQGHSLLPSEINYRANLYALKAAGVTQLISVSATGSLVKEIAPGQLAVPSQYIDFTKGRRAGSFFGDGVVAHVSTAEPVCPKLTTRIKRAAQNADVALHTDKAYACVEGPRLGTRAESFFLKGAGCHLVGMTNVPEVFLAREAQLCYCTIAVATDYDCWMDDPAEHVTVERMMALYRQSIERVKSVLKTLLEENTSQAGREHQSCTCRQSLQGAVLTAESGLSAEKKELLSFLRG